MEHPVMDRMDTDRKLESAQTLEQAALAGAAAIQRIIAERDKLRSLTQSQQSEMARLRAANDESRRRVLEIRHQYVEFATEILGRFEKFDATLRSAMEEPPIGCSRRDERQEVGFAQNHAPMDRPIRSDGRIF